MTTNAQLATSEDADLNYSLLAKCLFLLYPIIFYLVGYSLAIDTAENLKASENVQVDQLVFGLASACLRYGGMVMFVFSIFIVFGGKPNQSTPKWMIKRG